MTADKSAVPDDGLSANNPLSDRVLEQSDVNGNLQGINSDHRGLRALIQTSSVSHERLPMLEVVFDRLLRLLSTSMRHFTSDNVDVSMTEMTSSRFQDYLNNVQLPVMINIIKVKEWNTLALLILDNALIYTIIDVLLGGRREERHEGEQRNYTTIERTLSEEFIQVFLRDLSKSFEPVEEINFAFERMETNPRFAAIERPNNAGIIVRMHIKMDDRSGGLELFLPYSSIEPAREKLLQTFAGEKFGNDTIWENHLGSEVWNTEIEVEALLDKVTIKLSDVLKWKVGSFLPLETFEGANIVVQSGECRLYSGKIGNVRKRVAVQIEENYLNKEKAS